MPNPPAAMHPDRWPTKPLARDGLRGSGSTAPTRKNAHSRTLLVQLDDAFGRADADDAVRLVILAARGKNFSAGHGLGSEEALLEHMPGPAQYPTFQSHGATVPAVAERTYLQEWHYFFENTRRWRDLRKSPSLRCRATLSRRG
ncbi:enoyl-CoA hydratase/carnithine racemase [Mycobacterium sp. URHB0021]